MEFCDDWRLELVSVCWNGRGCEVSAVKIFVL